MRIHEETSFGRSESTCGYCRQKGHNQYSCPHVKEDWAFFKDFRIPTSGGKAIRRGWYGLNPSTWGSWYEHCEKTYNEIIKRENSPATTPRPKAKRTCGFCGSKDHTRRNCDKMDMFLKDCYTANTNWRRAAYAELVKKHGISVGASIIVTKEERWSRGSVERIAGIITSINWDKVTVFSALGKVQDDVHSPLEITVMLVNGDRVLINIGLDSFASLGKGAHPRVWQDNHSIHKVVARSTTPLGEEWITGYKESFDTLVKKRSLDQLKNGMKSAWRHIDIVAHINAWK